MDDLRKRIDHLEEQNAQNAVLLVELKALLDNYKALNTVCTWAIAVIKFLAPLAAAGIAIFTFFKKS